MVPLQTKNRDPNILWQTKVAAGEDAKKMIEDYVKASARIGGKLEVADDVATIRF